MRWVACTLSLSRVSEARVGMELGNFSRPVNTSYLNSTHIQAIKRLEHRCNEELRRAKATQGRITTCRDIHFRIVPDKNINLGHDASRLCL